MGTYSMNYPFLVEKPLTKSQLEILVDREGRFRFHIKLTLEDLVDCGEIESLNNLMDERVVKTGLLSELAYQVIGHQTPEETFGDYLAGYVILEVRATYEG